MSCELFVTQTSPSQALLHGSGTIIGNLTVGSTISPDSGNTITVFGNYQQLNGGTFDAIISPVSRALLDIHGDVALNGGSLLDLSLLDGYDPLGQTFILMQFDSLVGQFSTGYSFNQLSDLRIGSHRLYEYNLSLAL